MNARVLWFALPAVALAAILLFIFAARPLDRLAGNSPPVEEIAVETVRLTPDLISIDVRADGSKPVRIAQVQVDGAYRAFTTEPEGAIKRLGTTRVNIPYPWIEGETHHIVLLTATGAAFEHTIDVAVPTLQHNGTNALSLALIGVLLGVAPVAAGLLAYPAIRNVSAGGLTFILALTMGLLTFLFIDTLFEGLEAAAGAVERLRAEGLVWVSALATALVLLAVGRRSGVPPQGIALATFIALGIGLHNFGEGLAVGASLASGAAALATFLVVGFAIHNVSEGFGIATPLVQAQPPFWLFVALAALAGLPAVAGVFLGAAALSPYWIALCFGVGAGAIAQVIVEVGTLIARRSGAAGLVTLPSLSGMVAGLAVMYATALLV